MTEGKLLSLSVCKQYFYFKILLFLKGQCKPGRGGHPLSRVGAQ